MPVTRRGGRRRGGRASRQQQPNSNDDDNNNNNGGDSGGRGRAVATRGRGRGRPRKEQPPTPMDDNVIIEAMPLAAPLLVAMDENNLNDNVVVVGGNMVGGDRMLEYGNSDGRNNAIEEEGSNNPVPDKIVGSSTGNSFLNPSSLLSKWISSGVGRPKLEVRRNFAGCPKKHNNPLDISTSITSKMELFAKLILKLDKATLKMEDK